MSQKEAAEKLLSADDTEKRAAWQLVKQNKGLQRVINESFMIFMSRTEDTELLENLGIFWTTAFLQGMKFKEHIEKKLKK
jgi:hypothetical protein